MEAQIKHTFQCLIVGGEKARGLVKFLASGKGIVFWGVLSLLFHLFHPHTPTPHSFLNMSYSLKKVDCLVIILLKINDSGINY